MEELREKKEKLCEDIANMINKFLKDEKLEFAGLTYEVDWTETPKVKKIGLKVTV